MRTGEQIADFGAAVDRSLDELKRRLPADLILARVSDQPQQVHENIGLFMKSLYEAIALVVIVALIGFWEWRSAVLMALAIPITLAMTFGLMHVLGIDVQQVSIASLILALGLLVDDPVVAGDAIRRDLSTGLPRITAAWLGPTRLATAIVFATITNIVAYLPLLLVSGDAGRFIYSLPVVLTCSLVASRVVSMTFVPLLAYYLLRKPSKPELSMEERRQPGIRRLLLQNRRLDAAPPLACLCRVAGFVPSRFLLYGAPPQAVLPEGSFVPFLPGRVAARGRHIHDHRRRGRARRSRRAPGGGGVRQGASRQRRKAARHSRFGHHLCGRWRTEVLVFGDTGTTAAQLRASHHQAEGQARHSRICYTLAACPHRGSSGRTHRCEAD